MNVTSDQFSLSSYEPSDCESLIRKSYDLFDSQSQGSYESYDSSISIDPYDEGPDGFCFYDKPKDEFDIISHREQQNRLIERGVCKRKNNLRRFYMRKGRNMNDFPLRRYKRNESRPPFKKHWKAQKDIVPERKQLRKNVMREDMIF